MTKPVTLGGNAEAAARLIARLDNDEQCIDAIDDASQVLRALTAENTRLQEELTKAERLAERLADYAVHSFPCDRSARQPRIPWVCSCGLDALREESR